MRITKRNWAFLSLALLGLTGCPALGPLEIPGGIGGVNDDVIGEVQLVDNRTRELEIRSDSGRRCLTSATTKRSTSPARCFIWSSKATRRLLAPKKNWPRRFAPHDGVHIARSAATHCS